MLKKLLLVLLLGVLYSAGVFAGPHSHRYLKIRTAGLPDLPEFIVLGYVDDVLYGEYNSWSGKAVSRQHWIDEYSQAEDPQFSEKMTQIAKEHQAGFKATIQVLMQRYNQTSGVHTLQNRYGCELRDDATTDGFVHFGYDGEDFISFDKEKLTWVAAVDQAIPTRDQWNADIAFILGTKEYLEGECIELLNKLLRYGSKTLEQKVRPKVTVYDKPGSENKSIILTCMATGFHPRAIDVSWFRDGNTQISNAYTAGILPNDDGTFQIKKTVEIGSEDKRSYACHVDHSSLDEIMKVPWGLSNGLAPWIIIVIVIVVVVVAVLLAAVVGFVTWRRKERARLQQISSDSSSQTSSSASSDISTSKL
ncbi:class I histocompatibility antigen, F10 alpha chain-like [Latimeria chalumnae]|uniref:class I histocompatibility antigen, F10 alpha chain-like n=1 Tax=Latimeria chalumnae TaxID=7897 RepID=UPI00313C85F8